MKINLIKTGFLEEGTKIITTPHFNSPQDREAFQDAIRSLQNPLPLGPGTWRGYDYTVTKL